MPLSPRPLRLLAIALSLSATVARANSEELTEAPRFESPGLLAPEPQEGEISVLVDAVTKPPGGMSEDLPAPPPVQATPDAPTPTDEPADETTELLASLRKGHPWARFEPGAWRRIRTLSEAFDREGAFAGRSLTERTERLVAVDETTYTLEVETVVDLAGRRTPEPVETRRLWLLSDRPVDLAAPTVTRGETSSISLGSLVAPCRTWRVRQPVADGAEQQTVYLAPDATPTILRRERRDALDGAEPTEPTEFVESVTRTDTPVRYGDELVLGWHVSAVTTHPSGARTESFSVRCDASPGAVHRELVTEYDAAGQKSRWAVTELVAAGRTPSETIAPHPSGADDPAVSVEVRPRRLLRMLRREPEEEPLQ